MDEEVPRVTAAFLELASLQTCQFHISLSVPGTKDHIWKEKRGSCSVKITNIQVARAPIHYGANEMLGYLAVEHRESSGLHGPISWEEGHCKWCGFEVVLDV